MPRALAVVGLIALASHSGSPPPSGVRVAPVFWQGLRSPAFVVQCPNDSKAPRELDAYLRTSGSIRLDGVLRKQQGIVASLLSQPGERLEVAAGGTYTEVVVLGESPQEPVTFPPGLGYTVVNPVGITMLAGEHSAAFTCGSEWSDEVRFVWAQS